MIKDVRHTGRFTRLKSRVPIEAPSAAHAVSWAYLMSKTEAETLRDCARGEICQGHLLTDGRRVPGPGARAGTDGRLTVGDVLDEYTTRFVKGPTRRPHAVTCISGHLRMLRTTCVPAGAGRMVAFADRAIQDVTKADIEAIREARRSALAAAARAAREVEALEAANATLDPEARREVPASLRAAARLRSRGKGREVGINRLLARTRHFFKWAIAEGYIESTPFKRHRVAVVHLETRAETERTRRFVGDEEARLLAAADSHLKALIVAALSTGCRLGELLTLQWHQVARDAKGEYQQLVLPASRTKTNEARVLPIGRRLAALLVLRHYAPDREEHPETAYVFGNAVGERILRINTAWRTTCRKAGIVDLHFHDLRREFGCRLLETSAGLHDVREYLGHANISTTSRYLRSGTRRLAAALERLEASTDYATDTAPAHRCRRRTPESFKTGFTREADSATDAPSTDAPEVLDCIEEGNGAEGQN